MARTTASRRTSGVDPSVLDPTALPAKLAARFIGVTVTTLTHWRKKGAPAIKRDRKYYYDLPELIAWRRAEDIDNATSRPALLDVKPKKSDSIKDLALAALVANLGMPGVPGVQAAKAILAIGDTEEEDAGDNVVAFLPIDNVGGRITWQGDAEIACPYCRKVIVLADEIASEG